MPSKYYRRNFLKGYFYHIYNRGANKKRVFRDTEDYQKFTEILACYLTYPQGKPLSILNLTKSEDKISKVPNLKSEHLPKSSAILVSYCLMPNHFHLLLKQKDMPTTENSITNLMRRLIITYAMYTKQKYDRSGALFEGKFKNVFVKTDSQLLQLSKYIHLNPMKIKGSEPLTEYRFSSYSYFIGIGIVDCPRWLFPDEILAFFSRPNVSTSYQKFVEETPVDLGSIQKIILE
jgi:REP element-mobilizing transposase RayT